MGTPSNQNALSSRRRFIANAGVASALLACSALVLFPPARFSFYPLCPIREYLGFLCPGCGATRALAAILRGHLGEALRLNGLFVVLLPFAIFGAVRAYLRAIRPGEFRWPSIPTPALYATLLATATFTVARNLHPLSF